MRATRLCFFFAMALDGRSGVTMLPMSARNYNPPTGANMNVEIPQTYRMLHMLTPFLMDTIVLDPWPKGHAWSENLKADDLRSKIRRRPAKDTPDAWQTVLGSESDQRPETLYMLIQDAYTQAMMQSRLLNEDPDFTYMRTLLAAFATLRGFILNRRHTWDFTTLPADVQAVLPTDPYGPDE